MVIMIFSLPFGAVLMQAKAAYSHSSSELTEFLYQAVALHRPHVEPAFSSSGITAPYGLDFQQVTKCPAYVWRSDS